jgi:hypothetical protein
MVVLSPTGERHDVRLGRRRTMTASSSTSAISGQVSAMSARMLSALM